MAKQLALAVLFVSWLIPLPSGVAAAQTLKAIYSPSRLAQDSLHCPTLLPTDSTTLRKHLAACVEAWRKAGYLEASIDSLAHISPTLIAIQAHLGPIYRISSPPYDSVAKSYTRIPLEAAKSFAAAAASQLSPNDRVSVTLTLHDSTLSLSAFCDSITSSPLVELRQDGSLQLPERTLYALLHLKRNGSKLRQSDLKRINAILKSIPYVRVTHAPVIEFVPSGAILHVYLASQKANSLQAGFGFQPKPIGRGVNFYGDADINLQSLFKQGECFAVKWRLLQPDYHHINVKAIWDYIYGSAWGGAVDAQFKRQDSTASLFVGRVSLRFAPAAFQVIEAGYSFNWLVEKAFPEANSSYVSHQIRANGYSAGYQMSKFDFSTDWPHGYAAKIEASLSDRHPKDGVQEIILSVAGEVMGTKPVGHHGIAIAGSIRYENRAIAHESKKGLRAVELTRVGGASSIRGYLEESIATSHYAVGTIGLNWEINPWVQPRIFTDIGVFWDSPSLRSVISGGAGIVVQAAYGQLTIDVAKGMSLTAESPRGDWILHLAARFRF